MKIPLKDRIEAFLRKAQDIYKGSSMCLATSNKNVIRGRARCVAGKVEDELAATLYDALKDRIPDLYVFVDMPLSYEIDKHDATGAKEKDICYPDIIVAQRAESYLNVLYMVELKLNLGWVRNKLAGDETYIDSDGVKVKRSTIEEDVTQELRALTGAKTWSKPPVCMGKQHLQGLSNNDSLEFAVSKDTWYDLILCSSRNVPKDALKKARDRIGKGPDAPCKLYVLSDAELSPKHASKKQMQGKNIKNLCRENDVDMWEKRLETMLAKRGLK